MVRGILIYFDLANHEHNHLYEAIQNSPAFFGKGKRFCLGFHLIIIDHSLTYDPHDDHQWDFKNDVNDSVH